MERQQGRHLPPAGLQQIDAEDTGPLYSSRFRRSRTQTAKLKRPFPKQRAERAGTGELVSEKTRLTHQPLPSWWLKEKLLILNK